MALGPLVATTQREEVIDFTLPYLRARVSAVGPVYDGDMTSGRSGGGAAVTRGVGFRFLEPLSWVAWLVLLTVVPLVGAVLYCIERFSGLSTPVRDKQLENSATIVASAGIQPKVSGQLRVFHI